MNILSNPFWRPTKQVCHHKSNYLLDPLENMRTEINLCNNWYKSCQFTESAINILRLISNRKLTITPFKVFKCAGNLGQQLNSLKSPVIGTSNDWKILENIPPEERCVQTSHWNLIKRIHFRTILSSVARKGVYFLPLQ